MSTVLGVYHMSYVYNDQEGYEIIWKVNMQQKGTGIVG